MPHNLGKTVAIVQARLGSSRLPCKSLLCLRGIPLIDWVTHRLGQSQRLSQVVVAVPDTALDRVLLEHLERQGVACMAGPENDVLERFAQAARRFGADTVVRVCADNPLIWGEAVDRLLAFYEKTHCVYAYNHIPRDNKWPDGLGAEVFAAEMLYHMAAKATAPSQREHCCNYIWDNPEKFAIATFDPQEDWLCRPDLKLDIDRPEDFARLALLPFTPDMDARAIVDVCDAATTTP